MGKFEVGHKRSKGRPKGAINKTSKEIREKMREIISANMEEASERFSKLEDAMYFKVFGMMVKHVLPQQKQIESNIQKEDINYTVEVISRAEQIEDWKIEKALDEKVAEETAKMKARKLNY